MRFWGAQGRRPSKLERWLDADPVLHTVMFVDLICAKPIGMFAVSPLPFQSIRFHGDAIATAT